MPRRPRYEYRPTLPIERCEASGNKNIYANKVDAERAVERSSLERGTELYAYFDNACAHWHLTRQPPW